MKIKRTKSQLQWRLALISFVAFLVMASAFKETSDSETSAQNTPISKADCSFGSAGVIKSAQPTSIPNYFFRTFDHLGKEYVSYASSSELHLLDLKDSKEFTFKGDYDPVPMGADIMTTPGEDVMLFYRISDILKGNGYPKNIAVKNDVKLGGVYQSIGLLSERNVSKTYRLITDKDLATAADYKVDKFKTDKIEMVRSPTRICENFQFKLPMISKDGKMLSGYDLNSGTTKIWQIDARNPKKCTEIEDLGIAVGKADFSYDNNLLAFHTTTASDPSQYFIAPGGFNYNMNVYVYDRSKKTIRQMSVNEMGNSSYYPVFRPDNTIVYSQMSGDGSARFVHADPGQVREVPASKTSTLTEEGQHLVEIGNLWAKKCLLNNPISPSMGIAIVRSMNPKDCHKLINDFWDSSPTKLQAGDKEALLAACPKDSGASNIMQFNTGTALQATDPGEEIMAKKCSLCHADFSLRGLQTQQMGQDTRNEIVRRIYSTEENRMPKVGSLSEQEKSQIKAYLDKKGTISK